ncbi:hypothetical protein PtB15_13B352 [Puccinia triticina]|nr:hypothetical protein PtB15_13B352 [Puccinia triticina]
MDNEEPSQPWLVLPTLRDFPAATRPATAVSASAGAPDPHAVRITPLGFGGQSPPLLLPNWNPFPARTATILIAPMPPIGFGRQGPPLVSPNLHPFPARTARIPILEGTLSPPPDLLRRRLIPTAVNPPALTPAWEQHSSLNVSGAKSTLTPQCKAQQQIWKGLFRFSFPGLKQHQVCMNRKGTPQFVLEWHNVENTTTTSEILKRIVSTLSKMASMHQKNKTNGNKLAGQMGLIGYCPGTGKGKKGGTYARCPKMTTEDIKINDARVQQFPQQLPQVPVFQRIPGEFKSPQKTHYKASKAEAVARAAQKKNNKKRKRK